MIKNLVLFSTILIIFACQPGVIEKTESKSKPDTNFVLGVENLLSNYLHLVSGKQIGLLTNPSGVNSELQLTADLLHQHHQITLTALFGPEHGIRGDIYAGEKIDNATDLKTGIPVFSLYGETRKPSPEMLKDVDIILVDIQDIGLRAYTYIYTMAMVMEAVSETNKKVIVLDRPNPLGGKRVEGNIVKEQYLSFVGLFPIPYQHGMTIGELALLFNTEYGIKCDLQVIPMIGWKRSMLWEDTGLTWIPTSPHVPHWKSILYMGATGTFGELSVLSEGVGYTLPFELVGAPWIESEKFSDELNRLNLPGVYFRPVYFKPYYAHHAGQVCQGVQLHITNTQVFQPYTTGLYIMQVHMKLYPEHNLFAKKNRVKMFDKVVGNNEIRKALLAGETIDKIESSWKTELNKFKMIREKYLLYK